jgi:hypothetical protein
MYEILAKATQCCEEMRRNVATQYCEDENDDMLKRRKRRNVNKVNYCDVSSFKNKFFVQVRRHIRSLMQESNCEIKNFDVLEILQLKFSCMKIYTENFNFRWKMYDPAEKCTISLKNVWFADFRRFRQSLIYSLIPDLHSKCRINFERQMFKILSFSNALTLHWNDEMK